MVSLRRFQPISAKSAGFSLVEITIAIGIVSFVLIALIALLETSLSSQRESSEESAKISILNYLTAEVRTGSSNSPMVATNTRYYFDSLGHILAVQTNATPPAAAILQPAIYVAGITNVTNATFVSRGQIEIRHPYPGLKRSCLYPVSASR